jgi:Ubiquitin carboxyl-terminal hydrolase
VPYSTLYVAPETLPKPGGKDTQSTPSKAGKVSLNNGAQNPYEALLALPKEYWDPKMLNYSLSAVVVHKGEINSGHYVNYARKGTDWFLFDDSKVVLVDEAEVLGAEAYLLVYVIENMTPWSRETKVGEGGDADNDDD